jgi:hypothetical protein
MQRTHYYTRTRSDSQHTPQDAACPRCGVIDTPTVAPGNGPHAFREQCRHCGAFIKWRSQYTPAERDARRQQARQQAMAARPPNQAQLTYLQALGDDGPVPVIMLEASERIDDLKHGRVA